MSQTKKPIHALIPAVAYVRKSRETADETEKSITQQRGEIAKLAQGRYEVLAWYEDDGVSGWKRGAKRPDFMKMLAELRQRGAKAIVCDNLDRFSRASIDEVREDVKELRMAGVRYIITGSAGDYDLGKANDIGDELKLIVTIWAAHEYSRQLGRRISLARRNLAKEGKRSGGLAPYGMRLVRKKNEDGKEGPGYSIEPGDPKELANVRWLFEEYAKGRCSLHWLTGELNRKKVPSPRGSRKGWRVKVVSSILSNPAYKGDFRYGKNPGGTFFRVDTEGEVIDWESQNIIKDDDDAQPETPAGRKERLRQRRLEQEKRLKVFARSGHYKAVISPALFDKVQERMAKRTQDCSRRKRVGYALTGVLRCGHCGGRMYGLRPGHCPSRKRKDKDEGPVIYRCQANAEKGKGACGNRQVFESEVLPEIVKALDKEIADVKSLRPDPDGGPNPVGDLLKTAQGRKPKEEERDKLAQQIDDWAERMLDCSDKAVRQKMDGKIAELRKRLDQVEAELALPTQDENGIFTKEWLINQRIRIHEWWVEVQKKACSVPPDAVPKLVPYAGPFDYSEEGHILLDPLAINEALLELGATCTLRWATVRKTSKGSGCEYTRHVFEKGRLQIGGVVEDIKRLPRSLEIQLAASTFRS
jgi:DNA invertase Pin-like site-specific DNA recombinase